MPQLKCVGGSAAGKFTPKVVQCYNRGWDGQDVQWECKTDMDNDFRFGDINVICEGYDYPDDPYILAGSCGLEYTLDYTKEGQRKANSHDYYGDSRSNSYSSSYDSNSYYANQYKKNKWGGMGDLITLVVVGIIIYALYVTCLSDNRNIGDNTYSSTNDDYPRGNPGGGGWFAGNNNLGGGYRNNYGGYDDGACGGGARRRGTGGGGFWTGMATGGLMGYMFGNRG